MHRTTSPVSERESTARRGASGSRAERAQIGRDHSLTGGGCRQELAAEVASEQAAVEQPGVPLHELVEPERRRIAEVVGDKRHPRLRDGAVVLVRGAVCGGDVTDRRLDPAERNVLVVLAQLAPREADVLAMAELTRRAEQVGDRRFHDAGS